MKPRNKHERFVVEQKNDVPELTNKVKEWAYDLHQRFVLFSYKKIHFCGECNHKWNDSVMHTRVLKKIDCPKCKSKLKVPKSWDKDPFISEKFYFHKIEVVNNIQVVRVFQTKKTTFKTKKIYHSISEVCQHWYLDNGKKVILALKGGMGTGYYGDSWVFDGNLEPRSKTYGHANRTDVDMTDLYPVKKFSKYIKNLGIKNSVHGITPDKLFDSLKDDNKIETLFKIKQYKAVKYCINRGGGAQLTMSYWKSFLITIRNRYKIKDIGTWIDLLHHLNLMEKDIKSPKYICPDNLHKAHNKWVKKYKDKLKKKKYQDLVKSIKKDNIEYVKQKSKFFSISIKNNSITIETIKSVQEVYNEAEDLEHCVFSRKYHKERNSLLLSAKKDGERIETIEVSLKTFKVLQSRGLNNNPTKYNKEIINLVNQNINLIQKAI